MNTINGLKVEEEIRTATILFLDVVSYRSIVDQIGDFESAKLFEKIFTLSSETTSAHGGWVVKTAGDSLFLAFNAAENALDCALAIREALIEQAFASRGEPIDVKMRFAINTGAVRSRNTSYGLDLFGEAANVAARLESIAEPNEIVLSENTKRSLNKENYIFDEKGEYSIKNISNAVKVWSLKGYKEEDKS